MEKPDGWGVLKELGCVHEEQLLKIVCSILHLNSDNMYSVFLRKRLSQ